MPAKILLVGINDYAPVGPGGPDLRGCVNDVRDAWDTFVNVLQIAPPIPRYARVLTDGRATRDNITTGLRWLLTPMAGVDRLVFYYSGHGSWVVDTDQDEPDGRDETICPHDFATAGMIIDDEFRKLFSTLKPGITLEVIFDSCHSGSGTRELGLMRAAPTEEQVTIRYVEPPVDHSIYWEANPGLPLKGLLRSTGTRQMVPVPGMNHVLWAACRDDQTAAEALIGGTHRGIFSYCFFKALRRAGLTTLRRQLEAIVCSAVRRMGYNQIPQLEGNVAELTQPIFREITTAGMAAAAR